MSQYQSYEAQDTIHLIGPQSQWKRISHKQSARWQHLSRLKASAFFYLQKISC
jgi:hypothetical protein